MTKHLERSSDGHIIRQGIRTLKVTVDARMEGVGLKNVRVVMSYERFKWGRNSEDPNSILQMKQVCSDRTILDEG